MIGGQLGVYPLLLLNRKVETNEKGMFDVQSMFSQMLYSINQQQILQEWLCGIIWGSAWPNTERIFDQQWSNLIG